MHDVAAEEHQPLLLTAERALAALDGSLADKPDETAIETNARSLRGLASVVAGLHRNLRRCGGADCLGYNEDGMRTWVRSEELTRTADRARRAEARVRELEVVLTQIVEKATVSEGALPMAWDWDVIAAEMAAHARSAVAASCNP